MGEDDIGDRARPHRQRLPVHPTPGPFPLVEAAVHHCSVPVVLQQELAAGDGACGTKERQCGNHGVLRILVVGGCSQCPRWSQCSLWAMPTLVMPTLAMQSVDAQGNVVLFLSSRRSTK